MDRQQLAEYRYRAVREVLGGSPVGEVAVVIEDTHYRILHGEDQLAVRPRKNTGPITRLYVKGMGTQKDRQVSPDDEPSRKS
ncbi:hypothetical protein ACIRLA_15560 [Streptomyces sp. NPDC102364]|uniref:hypothetical protein n=1 Tax=Streptomyces sp. NPDC102364 TaxID=3366161 RepID=UPI003805C0B6